MVTSNQYRLEPGVHVAVVAATPDGDGSSRAARAAGPTRMSISEPFIRRPIATSLLMAGILLVGIVAFPLLPVAPLPQVDFPTIQVTRAAAGRESGDHGLVGGAAAGVPVRRHPRACRS